MDRKMGTETGTLKLALLEQNCINSIRSVDSQGQKDKTTKISNNITPRKSLAQ